MARESRKTKLNPKALIEELKAPGLIILGMVGSSMAGKLIDKVVKVDPAAPGFQAKALAKPIVQISAGLAGAFLLKNQNLKLIATGVTASGIASTVKVFLKKDILQGLTNFAGLGDAVNQIFREPVNLSIEPYNPDLPRLTGAQVASLPVETEEVNGMGEYQEIKEVQIM